MTYDVQIGNTIRRGLSYAELITYPIEPDTFMRRGNAAWIQAKDCVELTHILAQYSPAHPVHTAAILQTEIDDYSQDEYDEDEIDYYENEEDEIVELPQHTPRNQRTRFLLFSHIPIKKMKKSGFLFPLLSISSVSINVRLQL